MNTNGTKEISLLDELDVDTQFTIDEDVRNALIQSAELSEEAGSKVVELFEAAVNSKVREISEEVALKLDEKLTEKVEEVKVELTEHVSGFLDSVTEEWFENNKPEISEQLKAENNAKIVDAFLEALKTHYVEIPEDRRDILEEMQTRIAELTEQVNEKDFENSSLRDRLNGSRCEKIFEEVSEGLSDTEKEKFYSFVSEMSIDNPEVFEEKVRHVRDSFFKKGTSTESEKVKAEEVSEGKEERPSNKKLSPIERAAQILGKK